MPAEGPRFSLSNQYEGMNNGPHERPFVPIAAPCLAYHAAFWFVSVDKARHARRRNAELVREYFNCAREHFKSENQCFDELQSREPVTDRIRTWTVTFVSHGTSERVTLTAECHTEYWRLSVILGFGAGEPSICKAAWDLFALVSNLRAYDELSMEAREAGRAALVDDFEAFVMGRVLPPVSSDDAFWKIVKYCFCTFIGSVFWKPTPFARQPNYDLNANEIWEDVRFKEPRPLIRQLWPIIECLQGEHSAAPGLRDFEVTASMFLESRAIYASSLGHPKTPPSGSPSRVPVVYSLVVCFDDPWQLGRLLDTIHSMGTLRLAALRDVDKISRAARDLASIRSLLRKGSGIEKVQHKMELLLKRDVSWRIERSQRYWKQFQSRIKRLRIERIEGFQPYDSFVDRRIGDTITFIESTGRQLSFVRKEVDLRYQLQQTDSLEKNGNRIVALQKAGEMLLVIPLTYYAYMLCDKFSEKMKGWKIFAMDYAPWMLFSVSLLIACLALRFSEFLRKKEEFSLAVGKGEKPQ